MSSNSSTGQILGYVVGAVVGYFTGGTGWALVGNMMSGAAAGGAVGGMLDPPKGPTLVGPRLGDLSVQSATYGAHIPRIYGTVATMGNVFWVEGDKIKEKLTKKKSGGKGGGGSTVKTYSYSATFAVGLCEGPISGVRRIWIGAKLIYDAGSDDVESIIASNQAAQGFRVYLGTDTQQPDPRMQADKGAANTPAYRGLAYIAIYDYQLADHGNSLMGAQVKVEVVKSLSKADIVETKTLPSSSIWSKPAFGGIGVGFVTVRNSASCASSLDGEYWGAANMPASVEWSRVVHDGNIFCAVARNTTSVATSKNGKAWASGVLPSASDWRVLHHAGTVFLAIAGSVMTRSFNGINWFPVTSMPSNSQWSAAATKGGRTCVVSSYGPANSTPRVALSDDAGLSWMEFLMSSPNALWMDVETDGDKFVAVGYDEFTGISGNGHIAQSTDGQTWAYSRLPAPGFFRGIAYGNGAWVVTGYPSISPDGMVYASTDLVTWRLVATTVGFRATGIIFDGARFVITSITADSTLRVIKLDILGVNSVALSAIVSSEIRQSDIQAADINVTALSSGVRGYRVTQTGAIRAAIEPLQSAWPFDIIQSGYKIKAVNRGGASVATIPAELLDARAAGEAPGPQITIVREMDTQLPRRVSIKHMDIAREYDIGEQSAERNSGSSISVRDMEMPIVFAAGEAAQKAEVLLYLYWLERYTIQFKLPPEFLGLEPADVITITAPDASYELRLTNINYLSDGRLECVARYNSAAIYASTVTGEDAGVGGGVVGLAGPSRYELLDIPCLRSEMNAFGFVAAMTGFTSSWPGATLFRSSDNSQTWDDIQGFTGKCPIGYARNVIASAPSDVFDAASVLQVDMIGGELESLNELSVLAGGNHFAYGAHGRWEIIAAKNCVVQADGSYILTDFLRGRFGTEHNTGNHVIGDSIVLLTDPDLAFVGVDGATIGLSRRYIGITSGATLDTDTARSFTYSAVNLECLSPVYLNGHRLSGEWTLTWIRRTRLGGEWRDLVDATLSEASQAYEVDIFSDGTYTTIKRTLTSTTPTVAYTSAQQVTDFGASQSTIYVRVYQMSAIVGRGFPLQTSITRF